MAIDQKSQTFHRLPGCPAATHITSTRPHPLLLLSSTHVCLNFCGHLTTSTSNAVSQAGIGRQKSHLTDQRRRFLYSIIANCLLRADNIRAHVLASRARSFARLSSSGCADIKRPNMYLPKLSTSRCKPTPLRRVSRPVYLVLCFESVASK
jgi:hypothetical protein